MTIRTTATATLAALAGITAAIMLTFPATANAWDVNALPAGYFVSNYTTICHIATDPCVGGDGSTCNHYTVTSSAGSFAETDCVNPNFQQHLDAYIASTICAVNPAAGSCAVATTTAGATTVAAPPPTTTSADTSPTVTAPAPVTTVASTTTVTVTTVDPSVDARLTALEQRQATDEARITTLEKNTGQILGEPKNVEPFTSAAT